MDNIMEHNVFRYNFELLENEEFKSHPEFIKYHISNMGRVATFNKGRKDSTDGDLLKLKSGNHGYLYVILSCDGKTYTRLVHQLVLETFDKNRPSKYHARHLNNEKQDNRLENLCWGTVKENCFDKIAAGTHLWGEGIHFSKLTEDNVREIWQLILDGVEYTKIAQKFDVNITAISLINTGKQWKYLDGHEEFIKKNSLRFEYLPNEEFLEFYPTYYISNYGRVYSFKATIKKLLKEVGTPNARTISIFKDKKTVAMRIDKLMQQYHPNSEHYPRETPNET